MAKRHHRKPASRKNTDREIVVPPELRETYREFVSVVKAAEQSSGQQTTEVYRASDAIRFLNEHPNLTTYLRNMMRREEATAQALGQGGIGFAVSYAVPGMEGDFFPDITRGKHGPPTGSHPQNSGVTGGWTIGGTQSHEAQGVANASQLRYFADSNEWVRAAINVRRQQVGRADIAVVPHDERRRWDRAVMRKLQRLLDQPNELRDSYRTLMEPVIEDILVLDRGCISKNMDGQRRPVYLYYEDGATIKVYTDWDGSTRKHRYLFESPDSNKKVPLYNDELICMSANMATYRVGLSPVQWLRNTILAETRAIKSAEHYVDMKPPPHIVQIPGAHQTQISNLRNSYDAEVAGKKELFWIGGDNPLHVFPLTSSAKENQWLEWQQYLARKIAIAFQLSPQQFGFTADINKSTGEIQQQIFEDTGLMPLLLLLEEFLNRELLMDFAPELKDGRANLDSLNLRIVYPEISEAERALHAERASMVAQNSMAGLPSKTLNQILMMSGEEPVPGGNTFWTMTANGPVPWLTYDKEYGDWNPLATLGGMLGAQDVMSGPDEGQVDPSTDTGDDKNPNKPQPAPAPGEGAPAGGGASPAGTNPGAGTKNPTKPSNSAPAAKPIPGSGPASKAQFTPNGHGLPASPKKKYDTRKPGRHWNPSRYSYEYSDDTEK